MKIQWLIYQGEKEMIAAFSVHPLCTSMIPSVIYIPWQPNKISIIFILHRKKLKLKEVKMINNNKKKNPGGARIWVLLSVWL